MISPDSTDGDSSITSFVFYSDLTAFNAILFYSPGCLKVNLEFTGDGILRCLFMFVFLLISAADAECFNSGSSIV